MIEDHDIDDEIIVEPQPAQPAEAAELEAKRSALNESLKVAVDLAVAAGFEAEASYRSLQHLEWVATSQSLDINRWEAIEAALAALPHDATHQQIALAQARAIAATAHQAATAVVSEIPKLRTRVTDLVRDYEAREREVRTIRSQISDLDPKKQSWMKSGGVAGVAAVALLGGMSWLGKSKF